MFRLVRAMSLNINRPGCLFRRALQNELRKGLAWDMGGVQFQVRTYTGVRGRFPNEYTQMVTTLRPENLRPIDYVTMHGRTGTSIYNPIPPGWDYLEPTLRGGGRYGFARLHAQPGAFPKHSKGFLYFYIPPGQSPISGELRLRITPTKDPASFEDGYDFTKSDGFHWRVQLPKMPMSLRNLAVRDGLVSKSLLAEVDRVASEYLSKRRFAPIHFYLEQPFFVDFSSYTLRIFCAGKGQLRLVKIRNPAREWRPAWRNLKPPYTGTCDTAVVRLELSTLPEHAAGSVIVFRVLKILQPVECVWPNYDGYQVQPEEGSLITICDDGVYRPWTIKLDRNDHESVGLKLFLPGEQDLTPRMTERPDLTLDRNNLQFSDALHISDGQNSLTVPLGDDNSVIVKLPVFAAGHPYKLRLNSFGFLYYHLPPGLPAIAGEIRLRLTPTSDPASWDQGHDVRRSRGDIWSLSILDILQEKRLEPLLEKLISEGHVTPEVLARCKTLSHTFDRRPFQHVLYGLSQPFFVDFKMPKNMEVDVVGPDRIEHFHGGKAYVNKDEEEYKDKAWVRFEKSQDPEDIGKRIVTLRILDLEELNKLNTREDMYWGAKPPYGSPVMSRNSKRELVPYKMDIAGTSLNLLWTDE
ncbi:hypothetical protein BDZ94DRAFT_1319807 [Collybia nuda]|uniref:Uncharacterized protein n=1 Tax=Collybia nuda TaxID=64659 RepID=A0A9P6CMQ4_9AGAR|nr:hypothetical protein BDZ94DRAFT_1319807 [Collybia nuda]